MSQPLIMSFRPDAAAMCLDGRKSMTRRIFKKTMFWEGCDDLMRRNLGAAIEAIYNDRPVGIDGLDIGAPVWSVGKSIAIKPKRAAKAIGRVMCIGLKVEHAQDISEQDAMAEGVATPGTHEYATPREGFWTADETTFKHSARECFEIVWRRLNPRGPNSWESNPLVVAIEFRPLQEGEV